MPIAHAWPILRRVLYAAAGAAAWLPLYAIFVHPTSLLTRVALVALATLAAIKPASALLVVAAFVTIADPVAGLFSRGVEAPAAFRGPETLVLAFLGGWCLAGALGRRVIHSAVPWLRTAAAAFALVVGASVFVTMAALQARTTFPGEYVLQTARFVARTYLYDAGDLAALMQGAWLLEGAALLVAARAACLHDRRWRDASVRMMAVGGAAAGLLGLVLFATKLLQNEHPRAVVDLALAGMRFPAHVADTNAAGSGFALALLLALGLVAARQTRWLWIGAVVTILGGFALCASRSAIAAALVAAAALAAGAMRRRGAIDARRTAWAALAIVIVAAVVLIAFAPGVMVGEKALTSLKFRWYFTEMSAQLFAEAPAFGIGLSRFREVSGGYMNPVLLARYPTGENAHNYFVQVAAELGVVGLIPFIVLVWGPIVRAVRGLRRSPIDVVFAGIAGAAVAFLITIFTGHPFLTPAIAFAFWIVLGLCQAESERVLPPRAGPSRPYAALAFVAAVLVILVSLPSRVAAELRYVDFSDVAYGVFNWEQSDAGFRYRWTGRHARFFVPASARLVEIPVRALHFDPRQRQTDIDVTLDGREANHVVLTDANWRQIRLLIPPSEGQQFRCLDFTVYPTWSPERLAPGSGDTRELGVIVGELKITKNLGSDR